MSIDYVLAIFFLFHVYIHVVLLYDVTTIMMDRNNRIMRSIYLPYAYIDLRVYDISTFFKTFTEYAA